MQESAMTQDSHNAMGFAFDNSYARELEGFYVPWQAARVPTPRLIRLNRALADELGLNAATLTPDDAAALFAGNWMPDGATPLAQAYAGHQFGGFVPQLGDGRALLLGEVIDRRGQRRDIQFKGSGRTPFSRNGDGKAALGPVLREYLIGEAMHALGIPTTRALAVATTGEPVVRDSELPGAILTRVAASHIRVGTFEFFAARGEHSKVQQLADYSIARHYPALRQTENPYAMFLAAVCEAQAGLIARWMQVGFIHGVMNTDNMTISGETIDYGPCAFMDNYDPQTVFSSIDTRGRYAYGNQPTIANWNLARLADTLLPLIDQNESRAVEFATDVVNRFPEVYTSRWLDGMRAKLGLTTKEHGDAALVNDLLSLMTDHNADFTRVMRNLAGAVRGDSLTVRSLFEEPAAFDRWLEMWQARLAHEPLDPESRALTMDQLNPLYIPRNHKVEEALSAAVDDSDYVPFEKLCEVLARPFDERVGLEDYARPAPASFGPYRTFCGT